MVKDKKWNYWLEDLRSLKKRVAHEDDQFESISQYLVNIMNDPSMETGMNVQKKRCIEKMQSYRNSLLILMCEIRLLEQKLHEELPDRSSNDEDQMLVIPTQPSSWHWGGNTYDGIQRLTALLNGFVNLSDRLNEMLKSMSRICNEMRDNKNKTS